MYEVTHFTSDFISDVLVQEIGEINKNNPYLSMALIAIGIEYLGQCLDDNLKNWNEPDKSGMHFRDAIKKLMPKYKRHNLYDKLRNGYAHNCAPKNGLGIDTDDKKHLLKINGLLILSSNAFFNDFKIACEKVLSMIDRYELKNALVYKPYLGNKL